MIGTAPAGKFSLPTFGFVPAAAFPNSVSMDFASCCSFSIRSSLSFCFFNRDGGGPDPNGIMGAPSCGFNLPTLGLSITSIVEVLEFCDNAATRLATASDFVIGFVDAVDDDGGGGGAALSLSYLLFRAAIRSAMDNTIGSDSFPLIVTRCLGTTSKGLMII